MPPIAQETLDEAASPLEATESFGAVAAQWLKPNIGDGKRFASQEAYGEDMHRICSKLNHEGETKHKGPELDAEKIMSGKNLSPWEAMVLAAVVGLEGKDYLEEMKLRGLKLPPVHDRMDIDEIVEEVLGDRSGANRSVIPGPLHAANASHEENIKVPSTCVHPSNKGTVPPEMAACKRTLCSLFFGNPDRFTRRDRSGDASVLRFALEIGATQPALSCLMSEHSTQRPPLSDSMRDKLRDWQEKKQKPKEDKDLFEVTWTEMRSLTDWHAQGVRRSSRAESAEHGDEQGV